MGSTDVERHLEELWALLEAPSVPEAGTPSIHISANDSCISIENTCKNALDDELAGAVSRLFNRASGLPKLLERSIDATVTKHNEGLMRGLRVEALRLIENLLLEMRARERLGLVGEYVCDVVQACVRIFRSVQDSKVRAEAIVTLIAAIELRDLVPNLAELKKTLFPPDPDPVRRPNAPQAFWNFLATNSKSKTGSSETVRGGCMRVLGALAIHFPVEVSDLAMYETGQLYRTVLGALGDGGTAMAGQPEVSGALHALNGLLHETSLKPDELRAVFLHAKARLSLVESKEESEESKEMRRFGTPRAALQLLGGHLHLFGAQPGSPLAEEAREHAAQLLTGGGAEGGRLSRSLLLEHGEALWDALEPIWTHKNDELRGLADEVFRGFVKALGRQIAEVERAAGREEELDYFNRDDPDLRPRARWLFELLRTRIHDVVVKAASSATGDSKGTAATDRLGLAMNLLGSFAAPIATLTGALAIERQLVSLSEFAASYLQPEAARYYGGGKRSMDRTARQVPPFIYAHAALLAVVPAAADRSLDTCASLVLRLFASIDALPENSATLVRGGAIGVQRLLLALHAKGDALDRFLRRWVYNAAIVTIDAAAQARALAAEEGVEHASDFFGGLSARRLWIAILDFGLQPTSKLAKLSTSARLAAEADDSGGRGREAAAARKHAVCSSLLSALLEAICTMLRRLDLAATAAANADQEGEAEGAVAGAPASGAAAVDAPTAGAAGEDGAEGADEADASVGASLSLENADARNPSDVQMFLSLTAFTDVLLREVHPSLLLQWGHVLLLELIGRSGRYPHISGFYKLIRIVTTVLDGAGYFPAADAPSESPPTRDAMDIDESAAAAAVSSERARCYALLGSFLLSLQQRCRRFQGELLAAALELLLSAPLRFVAFEQFAHLPAMCDSMQLSLSMGHTYAPLCAAALDALERLHTAFPARLQPHLPQLLPRLHGYLTTSSETAGHAGTLRKERDARRNHSASTRAATVNAARSRLRRATEDLTQQRIVRLLGSVGGDAVALVHGSRAAPAAEGRWEVASRVGFKLPLDEGDVDLYIDDLLPRVVELATSSMVYREKAAACELLDAVVKLCIGQHASRLDVDWTGQYSHLFPAMLTLATDVDAFARSLFEPLTMQARANRSPLVARAHAYTHPRVLSLSLPALSPPSRHDLCTDHPLAHVVPKGDARRELHARGHHGCRRGREPLGPPRVWRALPRRVHPLRHQAQAQEGREPLPARHRLAALAPLRPRSPPGAHASARFRLRPQLGGGLSRAT